LDLFCCEGGAAVGYDRAGFDVVGVDIVNRPRYPFPFVQADALAAPFDLSSFDAIHASPPCQAFSVSTPEWNRANHPDLIEPVRAMLQASGLPYVIENVPGAPIAGDYMLCGTMFGLQSDSGLHVQRHRYFEVSWVPDALGPVCWHQPGRTMTVTGNGTPSGNRETLGRNVTVEEWRQGMGMPWASRHGLAQSIPPAYTEYIGRQLLEMGVN
jgi:DNA (cytosine-5)-methyltransferase 1